MIDGTTLQGGSWETVCTSPTDFEELASILLQPGRAPVERHMGRVLRDVLVPEVQEAHDKLERLKRKVLQRVVVAPRKKSSRVVALEKQREEERMRLAEQEELRELREQAKLEERRRQRVLRRQMELVRQEELRARDGLQRFRGRSEVVLFYFSFFFLFLFRAVLLKVAHWLFFF